MKLKIYKKDELLFFPLYISTIDFNSPQEAITRAFGYEMPQIFLVNSGEGVLNIDGKTYILEKDDLFYIEKNVPHEYYGTTTSFSTSYISFSGLGFDGIKKYYKLKSYGVYKNKNRGLFEASVRNLFEVFDTTYELSALCSLCFSLVVTFFDEACKKEFSHIELVHKYIEENYSKMITLDDILSVYPFSKAKLCREFKEKYDATIFEELTAIRLRNARYLIKNFPHFSLNKIALSCGFNDVSYFCKMYKRMFKTTPKEKLFK